MNMQNPPQTRNRFKRTVLAALSIGLAAAVTLSATGVDAANAASKAKKSTSAFPVTIKNGSQTLVMKKRPTRIVSLSPTATEMLFAIGAGKQVKAVDEFSNYPTTAPTTKLSGFTPNVEAIIAYKPDLVVIMSDSDATKALRTLKVPVMVLPAAVTLADSYAQIEQLGVVTGNTASAVQVSSGMQNDIKKIVAGLPKRTTPLRYFHEVDNTLYTATSKTFIGQIYGLLGMTNIADAADKDGSGYPQLSAEFLLKADPDIILLADTKCCAQSAKALSERGFSALSAVKSGQVVELDDDVASRWGPRVVDLLKLLATRTAAVQGTPTPVGA
jgi:iron complex transport system substrate-binding protein